MTLREISRCQLLIVLAFTLMASELSFAQHALSAREIAANARKAVVGIRAYSGEQALQQGSGFFIGGDGVFVTNIHVVAGADRLSIELESGEVFDNVYALALDERRDLVVLRVPADGVPYLEIEDDRDTEIGDTVYVVGNPMGLSRTFSDGLLSARRLEDGVSYLQISAPISQGSSGGPVLNEAGKVIGVTTLSMTGGQNLNMAVPARHASGLLALSGPPVAFETFAAALPQPEPSVPEGRAAETVALYDALPEEAQLTVDDMSDYQRQATIRLLAASFLLMNEGWEFSDHKSSGVLAQDKVDAITAYLQAGEYFVVGVCDDDCLDLDLHVFDSSEDLVASDTEMDTDALVQFSVARPGNYLIGASMESCATRDCLYLMQVYEK